MLIKTPKEQIKEYFASHGLSQSKLKLLPQGVAVFNKYGTVEESDLYFQDKEAFLVGSAADCLLTESREIFNETYHMSDGPKPGEKIMSMVTQLFDMEVITLAPDGSLPASLQQIDTTTILDVCDAHSYQMKWKTETRINKVITEGEAYYQSLVSSVGKRVLSLEQSTTVEAIYESIITNENTKRFFVEEACPKHIDVYHQLIIHFEINGVAIQCLLDILEVNHHLKTVKVHDFKTMFDKVINFPASVRLRRYDFQVVIYTMAVSDWMRTQPQLDGYTLLNPGFIVETTAVGQQGRPLMFTITAQMFKVALFGINHTSGYTLNNAEKPEFIPMKSKRIWGIYETVELYKWHLENGFDQDKVVAENEGKLKLNWEGIVYEDSVK